MLSSIAEKTYWLSRYIERIENTSRLINVNSDLLLDIPHDESNDLKHLIKITGHFDDFKKSNSKENVFFFLIAESTNLLTALIIGSALTYPSFIIDKTSIVAKAVGRSV